MPPPNSISLFTTHMSTNKQQSVVAGVLRSDKQAVLSTVEIEGRDAFLDDCYNAFKSTAVKLSNTLKK
jgi:hypothetical protein